MGLPYCNSHDLLTLRVKLFALLKEKKNWSESLKMAADGFVQEHYV